MARSESDERGWRILNLHRQVEESDQWKRLNVRRFFELSVNLFRQNEHELVTLIEWGSDPLRARDLWNYRYRGRIARYQHQIVRLLHNYVAAAESLVAHARHVHDRHYHDQMPDYREKVAATFHREPVPVFIKGLRNYVLHFRLPPLAIRAEYGPAPTARHWLPMSRDKLLEWDGWKQAPREWLTGHAEDVDLRAVVLEYQRLHQGFYQWYYRELDRIHEDDLRFVRALERERLTLTFQGAAHSGPAGTPPESIFYGLLPGNLIDKVMHDAADAEAAATVLLDHLAQEIEISPETRQRALAWFRPAEP